MNMGANNDKRQLQATSDTLSDAERAAVAARMSEPFGHVRRRPDETVIWPEDWDLQQKHNHVVLVRKGFGPKTVAIYERALRAKEENSANSGK